MGDDLEGGDIGIPYISVFKPLTNMSSTAPRSSYLRERPYVLYWLNFLIWVLCACLMAPIWACVVTIGYIGTGPGFRGTTKGMVKRVL